MVPDIKVEDGSWACPPADGDCNVTISTVSIDLNEDDRPQDFGEEILLGEVVCDEATWRKFKRRLEAMDNMVSCIRMMLETDVTPARKAAGVSYAKSILEYVDKA